MTAAELSRVKERLKSFLRRSLLSIFGGEILLREMLEMLLCGVILEMRKIFSNNMDFIKWFSLYPYFVHG